MSDQKLVNLIHGQRPKMNLKLIRGLAYYQSAAIEDYIHQVWKSVALSFPEGLKYIGSEPCTPQEHYALTVKVPRPRCSWELADSSVYMRKYLFTFNGESIRPRYILLPFVRPGGLITLKGTNYKITPVLGGKVFNIEKGKIFMSIVGARLAFDKHSVSFVLNNKVCHANMIHGPLYNMVEKDRSKLHSSLVHYILANFGFQYTMANYFGVKNPKLGGAELDSLSINGEYYVYKSRRIPPMRRGRVKFVPSEIRIAIPKDEWSPILDSVIGSVFYIIDNCSEEIEVDDMGYGDLWLRVLPRFIFRVVGNEYKRFDEMVNHLDSVRRSMNPLTIESLLEIDIQCETIFDLFTHITKSFHDMVVQYDVGTMYNLELTTVKHICYHIVHNIFILRYELKKLTGDRVNIPKITHVMDTVLRRDRIFTVKGHGELSSEAIATDCMLYSATCNMISQSKAASVGRGGGRYNKISSDVGMLLHSSQVEVSTTLMSSKSDPSSRSKMNPFMYFSKGYTISPRPELEERIHNLGELIHRERE